MRFDTHLALLIWTISQNFKIHIVLKRIHLTIASHNLKVISKHIRAFLILFHKWNRLVVNDTIGYRLRMQEFSIYENIKERETCNCCKLVGSKFNQFSKLLLSFPYLVLLNLFSSFILVSLNFLLFDAQILFNAFVTFN